MAQQNETLGEIADAQGILAEPESKINLKLLGLITIIFLSTQINSRVSRCVPTHFYRGEHGLTLVLAIVAGVIFDSQMTDEDVSNLLYSQALIFKLLVLPPVFYDLAYNTNLTKPGSFV